MRNFFSRYIKFITVLLLILVYGISIFLIQHFSSTAITQTSKIQVYEQPNISTLSNKFVIIGDSGNGSVVQYDVGKGIKDICARLNCGAAFIVGDVIYDYGVSSVDDPQFQEKFEKTYNSINIPFYIAYGNHDYLGCTECYLDYSAVSSKWRMPARYYTVTFAENGKFIIIDTENFDIIQQEWLRQELAKTEGWRVVIGHRPLITYEEAHANDNWSMKATLEEILCTEADIYVSGHAHLLEDVGQVPGCEVRQVISGGGGQTPRKILSDNNSQFYYEGNGLITVQAESKRIIIKFLNEKGKILYSLEMTR